MLECVSTYIHEVASLNAGNIFSLRLLADILAQRGEGERAAACRAEAAGLARLGLPDATGRPITPDKAVKEG